MNKNLTIGLWNLENFFVEGCQALLKSNQNRPKDMSKREEIGSLMHNMDADIWCLSEIGGRESLEWINRELLNDQFYTFFPSITSRRGIDNGILLKKNLGMHWHEIVHLPTFPPDPTRDARAQSSELSYWRQGQRAMLEMQLLDDRGKRFLQLYHVHLKSPVTEIGKDPNGKHKRRAELNFLLSLVQNFSQRHPDIPVVVAGDFNCGLQDQDLQNFLAQSSLVNYLDFTIHPPGDQWSLAQRTYGMTSSPLLIDFMLIRPAMGTWLNQELSGIWSLRDRDQQIMSLPKFAHLRHQLPSDHRPQVLSLNIPS